jgi:hypothetical protein
MKSDVENSSRTNTDVAGFPSSPTLDKKINVRQAQNSAAVGTHKTPG